ncbi:MAG: type II toxin-antitoxin system RelE/ParE family toxin [Pirellulaceae bacterium]
MPKKFQVDITASAEADVRLIHAHIASDNLKAADRWAGQIERMMLRLETLPFGHEVIPEAADLGVEYRHKLFGNYRIIYRVMGQRVVVMRVIHAARLLGAALFS